MRRVLRAAFAMVLLAGVCLGQTAATEAKDNSLCLLQDSIRQGEHEAVRVSGIFSEGLELGILHDTACPNDTTWVELELRSKRNRQKLSKLLDRSRQAYVVFEGEFYGPPLPDPKLPESIRNAYHPNWGHLNCCRTKLVVYEIREVNVAPPDPSDNTH